MKTNAQFLRILDVKSLYVYDVHAHVMIVLSLYLAKLCSSMSPFPFHSEVHPIAYEH